MKASGLQIRSQLGDVDFFEGFDGFQFQNHLVFDDEVKSLRPHVDLLEIDVNVLLSLEGDLPMLKGNFHGPLVDRLDKARSQCLMTFHGHPQDSTGERVKFVSHSISLSCFRPFVLS